MPNNKYTMKMGSRQIDGDTAFRMDSYAMQYNYAMKNDNDPNKKSKRSGVESSINLGAGTRQEKLGNPRYVKPGDTVNVSPDRINILVNKAGFRRPENAADSIYLSNSAYNTRHHSGGLRGPAFERSKKAYNSRLHERTAPINYERRNQLKIREVSLESPGFRNIIKPYSKRSGKEN
tara:strand:+ start:19 stop:549 length:531 start_codon:yes stop_codon:yes gene_type:complete